MKIRLSSIARHLIIATYYFFFAKNGEKNSSKAIYFERAKLL
jgi:hypothetical protein